MKEFLPPDDGINPKCSRHVLLSRPDETQEIVRLRASKAQMILLTHMQILTLPCHQACMPLGIQQQTPANAQKIKSQDIAPLKISFVFVMFRFAHECSNFSQAVEIKYFQNFNSWPIQRQ